MSTMRFKHDQDVTIEISEKLYNDILSLVNSTDLEITLLLELEKLNKYNFKIINYFIPPQWNESAESKTLDSKYPQWCMEQIKAGHKLNGHMHSHPSFSVSPSGYDNAFFEGLIKETNSFQARFIINQKGFITADIINETDNYIAENCTVKIICDNFNILANATELKADVDFDKLQKRNICLYKDLTIELIGNSLVLNTNTIVYNETVKYTPTRKQDTDEGYKTQHYNYGVGYNTKSPDEYLYKLHNPISDPKYNDEFYGYTDEEIQIAKDMHFKTADELEEYLLEMEAFADANSK